MSNKRGNKKHMAPVGQDFFALGSSSTSTSQTKLPAKRSEAFQSPITSMSPKRPKLNSPLPQSMPTVSQPGQISAQSSAKNKSWEDKAIIVPIVELKDQILQCDSESESEELIERILCGAVKQLREQKTKPDSCLIFTLLYLAKIRPLFFCSSIIVDAFSSLLKREHLIHFKSKSNTVPVLVINLFYHAFHDENSWPDTFIKLYIEDSLADRIWVDNEECKEFVDIIVASFRTKLPPKSLLQTSDVLNPTISSGKHIESSPSLTLTSSMGEDSVGEDSVSSSASLIYEHGKEINRESITSRFLENENQIISYVTEIINENLSRRPTINDISRNMLKLLIATAGLRNVRLLVAQKLEMWFQNPKLSRPAQDLLLTIFLNCDDKDAETLSYLLKMRLKNKPFNSHFIVCFKELLNQKNGTFDIVLRILLSNEMAGIRNMNNIQLISIMFQMNPNDATAIMAQFFFSMIYSKEDNLRILRSVLREIVRIMKIDSINYLLFAQTLMFESKKIIMLPNDGNPDTIPLKKKIINEIVDIVTMNMFLSANQNVRESIGRLDRKEVMRNFQMKISTIQCEAIKWIHEVCEIVYLSSKQDLNSNEFIRLLKKIFIMEPLEAYYKVDNWPSDAERMLLYRLTTENIPIMEETVKYTISMAFRKVPLQPQEACDLIWALIQNATITYDGDMNHPVLLLKDVSIINHLFQCCAYVHPENAKFPENYVLPNLARAWLYWKVWFMLVIMAAHVPKIFGHYGWEKFQTFQALIEMAITNNFQFPPKSMDTEEMQNRLMQANQSEKLKIIEFETYLAGDREINENNSYLLSSLMTLDPTTITRRPPNDVLEEFKKLFFNPQTNGATRLWHLLCQSRDPDFLLKIIDKQQNLLGSQIYLSSLNWLIDLVESYENNYGLLPVQCLCEYLLKQIAEELSSTNGIEVNKSNKAKRRKLIRLVEYFREDIANTPEGQTSNAFKHLTYYLGHSRSTIRMLAYKSLYVIATVNVDNYLAKLEQNMIPSLFVDERPGWFQKDLVSFLTPPINGQIQTLCVALYAALSEESDPNLICDYLEVLARFVKDPDEALVTKCSQMLIERKKIPNYVIMCSDIELKTKFTSSLNQIYIEYLRNLIFKTQKPPFQRNEGLKYVYFKARSTRQTICLNIHLIHGMIIMISLTEETASTQDRLLTIFSRESMAQIFEDPELTKPVQLIPEWLVERLIHTRVPFVINAILSSLPITSLIKFLDHYGVSLDFVEAVLQKLDKLSMAEAKLVDKMDLDQKRLLDSFQVFWEKGLRHGKKFAEIYLNYSEDQSDSDEDEDDYDSESMDVSLETTKKTEIIKTRTRSSATFKEKDIERLFEEKSFDKLHLLARFLSTEMFDTNVKMKKFTRIFLDNFHGYMESLIEEITNGTFNSIFNMIINAALKTKHTSLNQEFSSIEKILTSASFKRANIPNTLFWKCFQRYSLKDNQKAKKVKVKEKKSVKTISKKLSEFLDKVFPETMAKSKQQEIDAAMEVDDSDSECQSISDRKLLNLREEAEKQAWFNTYVDFTIEKFHKIDLDSENYSDDLLAMIFSRDRPYFLSLLLHRSNFSTLNKCIRFILGANAHLNPTPVLDFLTVCIDSPKLWIGRENDSQKVIKHEDVLDLNYDQIKKLIDYVILENNIKERIDLVLRTCCITTNKTDIVINSLKDCDDKSKKKINIELYARLYLEIPNIGFDSNVTNDLMATIQIHPSFMDKIMHNLITSFMFVEASSAPVNPQLFNYWEHAMLKIASKHPLLFIRQLPMIPAMLRGKVNVVHYDVFKSLNLFKIFSKLLNMLNLLRPHLWKKNVKGLEQILSLYMDMFMSYYQLPRYKDPNQELLPLLVTFLRLINDWIKHDSESSNHWIKKHENDFTELSSAYESEKNLFRSIVTSHPLQDEHLIVTSDHYQALCRNLKRNKPSNDVLTITLNDINKMIDKYPWIVGNFLNHITPYYTNPFFSDISFSITLKTLQLNPNLIRTVVVSYVKCLQCDYWPARKSALSILPEFVLLAQDYRYLILRKVFELSIAGEQIASTGLIEAFRALNSQIGC